MSLLLSRAALAERRDVVAGPLSPLARSLAADLQPLRERDLYFPEQKAVLSREGGRCAQDGTLLAFDPFQPHSHVCPRCGTEYRGDAHDRFWIYWYQLWLAERAVHAAALHALGVAGGFDRLAADILDGYVDRYASYPNVDNVLGPTRLFFSTYLESIWLLQIVIAVDLVAPSAPALADRVRDRIVEPSRAIIAEYDEGASNRQVWNDAALLAAARLVGDQYAAEQAVFGRSGIVAHLSNGLLADGTWYEGENYHLFAHRGLWYGVTMAEEAGLSLPEPLVDRFQRGFATPFATALPDLALPSRRDSQYAISLRQWRIAEHVELGLARRFDTPLAGALERLYRDDIPHRETGRRTSSADVERNAPASSLTRADLSWRALLCGLPELPALEPVAPRSSLLESQGIAVFRRRAGRTYVALDYGHSGGGHGHPDRLNLLLVDGATRWLDDFGTGSYVDPSLHWYRSTLAHNAPLVGGRSQPRRDGDLVAYEERDEAGWIVAKAEIARGAEARRTIVVMEHYLIDRLSWTTEHDDTVDLPIHADIALVRGASALERAELEGGQGLEDGFRFLADTARQRVASGETVEGRTSLNDETLALWAAANADAEWWRATAPGPPGSPDRQFRIVRTHGTQGSSTMVLAWSDAIVGVELGDEIRVSFADGTRHVHRPAADATAWHIELRADTARRSINLGGVVSARIAERRDASEATRPSLDLSRRAPVVVELGERHYRRSELTWAAAGRPSARVVVQPSAGGLRIAVDVPVSDLNFARADATNPYDNEHPDINGDGVELFVQVAGGRAGWVLVPELDSAVVRIRPVDGWNEPVPIRAEWRRDGAGYHMDIELGALPQSLDVIVNEMPRGRERRRGQLVSSGAAGEFVYLRGDRHDPDRLIPLRVTDD